MRLPSVLATLLSLPLLSLGACSTAQEQEQARAAWEVSGSAWRTDPVWFDGQAETAEYEGRLEIYGIERPFRARVHTLHQHMDPETTTKAEGAEAEGAAGIAVFKQIATERVPTESYDYHFSITTFTRSEDLSLYKLTRAVQEECGASFTLLLDEGRELETLASGYFPGEGIEFGSLASGTVALEQLPLLLRDFPFELGAEHERHLEVLPSLRTNRLVPLEPRPRRVRYAGAEELELPIGRVRAHRLELLRPDDSREAAFWFHAEGAAPWLHVLVALEGPGGHSWRLASHRRAKYWERP
jgi:hypothetical protein